MFVQGKVINRRMHRGKKSQKKRESSQFQKVFFLNSQTQKLVNVLPFAVLQWNTVFLNAQQ